MGRQVNSEWKLIMKKTAVDSIFYLLLFATQVIAAIFYGIYHYHIFTESDSMATAVNTSFAKYPLFQDVHIMVFVGIGFLFAFLKRHKLSSIAEVFWVAAITVQYYFLWNALFDGAWRTFGDFYIWTFQLIKGEFCAIAMVIAIGAVVGKVNNLQLLIMLQIGILLYAINEQILFSTLDVMDIGGSMYVFQFGAFYGVGVSWILNYQQSRNNLNFVSNVTSNTFALIGTLFLWCFFLSFNSALAATPVQTNIAVVNTYFCLIGSVIGAYLMSNILHKGRFHMEHLLNSTLVGGILMGAGANILRDSFVAYIVGGVGGILSALMYTYGNRILRKFGLVDVAGVIHTFAIPGMLGGILSAIYRARYFDRGGIQVAGTFISMGISLAGGLIVGFLIRFLGYYIVEDEYYNDVSHVYFDDVADFQANQSVYYDRQRRLLFGEGQIIEVKNIVRPTGNQHVQFDHNINDREVPPNV